MKKLKLIILIKKEIIAQKKIKHLYKSPDRTPNMIGKNSRYKNKSNYNSKFKCFSTVNKN